MADFAAVLRKTIGGLKENTPEARAKVYEKARATIEGKLAAMSPPPPPALAARQKKLLDEAIAEVEAEYAAPAAEEPDTAEDLDAVLAAFGAQPDEPRQEEPETEAEALDEEPAREGMEAAPEEEAAAPAGPEATPAVDDAADEDGPQKTVGDEERLSAPDEPLAAGTPTGRADAAPEEELPDLPYEPEPRRARRGARGLVIALLLLAVLGAAAYGAWLYQEDITRLAGFGGEEVAVAPVDTAPAEQPGETAAPAPQEEVEQAPAEGEETPREEGPRKFTQRLLPDGREVDEGPAEGEPALGEGTSVAEATQAGGLPQEGGEQAGEAQGGADEPAAETTLPVGQRAIFYEEGTSASQGSADAGSVVWSIEQRSPGEGLPPEPVINAHATIPDKDLRLELSIRRNVDQSLPASHIIELIFLTPPGFEGGAIDSVRRIALKRSEQDTGSPLAGIPAKIEDGFFVVALSDREADVESNRLLLGRQSWIDIPITYTSGRRALITMEKGVPGDRIFDEALAAWERASSG